MRTMVRACIMFFAAVPLSLALVGCGGKGPSDEVLKEDCKRLAEQTHLTKIGWNVAGDKSPTFECMKVEPLDRSVDGKKAEIRAHVSLKLLIDSEQTLYNDGGGGFGGWFNEERKRKPGQVVRINVRLQYHRYNTGWKLENILAWN